MLRALSLVQQLAVTLQNAARSVIMSTLVTTSWFCLFVHFFCLLTLHTVVVYHFTVHSQLALLGHFPSNHNLAKE